LGFLNNFLGGAFNNASIFALGIMPTSRPPSLFSCFHLLFLIFRNFKRKATQEGNVLINTPVY
jgi:preprotein translocase subunit SecY